MLSLSPRLAAAAQLVQRDVPLADIGCGHGKLCFFCLQSGIIPHAIGVDCSAPTLQSAQLDAAKLGLSVEFRHGDGLQPIAKEEVGCAVIAGMGGNEIVQILSSASYCVPVLVLVPHKNPELVRKYLFCAGYQITYDAVVLDANHWYHVIRAEATRNVCVSTKEKALLQSGQNWYYGKDNLGLPAFALYRQQRIKRLETIVADGCTAQDVLNELQALAQSKGE